jgi:hypothetical protein
MKTTIEMAREAKVTPDIVAAHGQFFTRIEHLVALARADERAALVQDENQAFIDSLPTDSDDKMYMQIHHWARQSYARHKSLVAGQMITAGDASDTHIIWATLRWAKENTPPAPAPVPHPVIAGMLFDFMGWLTSREARLTLSSTDDASPAVEAITEFAKMRGLSLDDARVQDWQDGITKDGAA